MKRPLRARIPPAPSYDLAWQTSAAPTALTQLFSFKSHDIRVAQHESASLSATRAAFSFEHRDRITGQPAEECCEHSGRHVARWRIFRAAPVSFPAVGNGQRRNSAILARIKLDISPAGRAKIL